MAGVGDFKALLRDLVFVLIIIHSSAPITIIYIKLKDLSRKDVDSDININFVITKFIVFVYILQPIRAINDIIFFFFSFSFRPGLTSCSFFNIKLF
jgi:hypothetical protein